jgi:hypothetical protein
MILLGDLVVSGTLVYPSLVAQQSSVLPGSSLNQQLMNTVAVSEPVVKCDLGLVTVRYIPKESRLNIHIAVLYIIMCVLCCGLKV